jgi:3-oxoacyl-[acyl-carrier protein] reductase
MGNPGQVNYAASKAGVEGFTRSIAREVASRGITINCIAPGFIDTDMTKKMTEEQRSSMLKVIPAQRFGESEEIAALVSFLLSNEAGYINGETIHINGGMYMG